nr:IS1595 family transposase [Desulfobulbaceae bacterium]
MKMNRIQFQKGLSLNQFFATYGKEQQCESALESARWPQGFICPKCSSNNYGIYRRGQRVKVFQCKACRGQTTLTEGTIFHSSKLPLTTWFQAMFFQTQNKNNISILEFSRLIGVSYRTAWRTKHKLMEVMFEHEQTTKLSERIEIDDAYLGGELPGGKVGRGSENKVPFIAAVQTNLQGHPLYAVFTTVKSFCKEEVELWAKRSLRPSSLVVSDGLWCFQAVEAAGCFHQREVVGKDRKSTSMGCFRWVNTILGNLKNSITGTYHAFDFEKYAHRYLGEFQYRFNRRFDLAGMFTRLVFATARSAKVSEHKLRIAED